MYEYYEHDTSLPPTRTLFCRIIIVMLHPTRKIPLSKSPPDPSSPSHPGHAQPPSHAQVPLIHVRHTSAPSSNGMEALGMPILYHVHSTQNTTVDYSVRPSEQSLNRPVNPSYSLLYCFVSIRLIALFHCTLSTPYTQVPAHPS